MESAFEKWARSQTADKPLDLTPCKNPSCGHWPHYLDDRTAWTASAWDAALEERDKAWQSWRKQLLDAWANDYRATMTALLEGGPEFEEARKP